MARACIQNYRCKHEEPHVKYADGSCDVNCIYFKKCKCIEMKNVT